jgi:hypothetical protein
MRLFGFGGGAPKPSSTESGVQLAAPGSAAAGPGGAGGADQRAPVPATAEASADEEAAIHEEEEAEGEAPAADGEGAEAADGAAAGGGQPRTGGSSEGRPRHGVRLSTVNGDALVSDYMPPADYVVSSSPPPPFLRGPVLNLYNLKQNLLARVSAIVEGDGGLVSHFGFQGGPKGAARAAVDGLVADLIGAPGAVYYASPEEAVAELHEKAFENFNRWARMVRRRGDRRSSVE